LGIMGKEDEGLLRRGGEDTNMSGFYIMSKRQRWKKLEKDEGKETSSGRRNQNDRSCHSNRGGKKKLAKKVNWDGK